MSPKTPALRGIRGAITVSRNSRVQILDKTERLLRHMVEMNGLLRENIASIIFTVTRDLNAEFPAVAARRLGMTYTPLLCTYEIDVPQSMPKCIRVLMHVNTTRRQREMKNIYLDKAHALRPPQERKRR